MWARPKGEVPNTGQHMALLSRVRDEGTARRLTPSASIEGEGDLTVRGGAAATYHFGIQHEAYAAYGCVHSRNNSVR